MDHSKQLAFIANMTDRALQHVASTPNIATPTGGMTHDKMLSFVTAMTKHGLQHFDAGGTTLGNAPGTSSLDTTQSGATGVFADITGSNDNFQGQSYNLQRGTNAAQLNNAYTGVQNALGNQQNLVTQTSDGLNQGLTAQATIAGQLANEAAGNGPNPAMAELNQATGQNIAQQAALAAGQRGAGANAGLAARQNAQQGAATQQAAIGQGATLQAQQQLAAQTAGANLASTQVGQGATAVQNLNQQQQNEQHILQGANSALNSAGVQMQGNINNVDSQVSLANQAAGNAGFQQAMSNLPVIGGFFAKGGMVRMDSGGNVLDAEARSKISDKDFALPGGRYPIQDEAHARNALARVSQNGSPEEKAKVKAAVRKKYPDMGAKKMADGGSVDNGVDTPAFTPTNDSETATSSIASPAAYQAPAKSDSGGGGGGAGLSSIIGLLALANGGTAEKAARHYDSYFSNNSHLMKNGGMVIAGKGQQAVSSHDSYENDKVPAMLSQGEVVIDKDTLHDKGAIGKMARAVAKHIDQRNKKK